MKKLLLTLVFIFLFLGCERDEIKPYFVGEWTTYMPTNKERTDSLNICFEILNIHDIEYYTYHLEIFKFSENDSTISFKVHLNQFYSIIYYGKYNKEKDMFTGNSYHYNKESIIFGHLNVLTTREMIYH